MGIEHLTLTGGRQLAVLRVGAARALTLVYHAGTPVGLVPEPELVEAAAAAGIGLVMIARPGYPGSTRLPGRTVASVVPDTAEALEQLGCGEVVVLGWSGGGPHALACAALLPTCRAAASLAGIAPDAAGGLDLLAGMAPENVAEFTAAREGEEPLRRWLTAAVAGMAGLDGPSIVEAMGGLLPAADVAALTSARAAHLARAMTAAVSDGVEGWLDDDLAFVRPWGFTLSEITVPVTVWQGGQDTMVPAAHGHWLAGHVPAARSRLLQAEGHLSLGLDRMGEIVGDLVAAAG